MFPDTLSRQRGAGLPVALFIITVLALIVAGMAQLQQSTGQSVSLQIQSQRAFYAAESGAQVGVMQVLANGQCSDVATPINFSVAGLQGCSAALLCRDSGVVDIDPDDGDDEVVFTIESRGSCGSGTDRAQRIVEVRVR